jgi:lysozyme
MLEASQKGVDLIKEFEGLKLKAYKCSAGVNTIGYGTTVVNGVPVKPGDTCTQEEAEEYLLEDITNFLTSIEDSVTIELSQNQIDAIGCFTYNVGVGAFKKSTLLKKINAGDFDGAANEFLKWNKAGGKVLPGLTRRREAERDLFLS